ncbi:MAG: class I SAM-dependent methyltransferase [Candidatus Saccharimonadales bacterium]
MTEEATSPLESTAQLGETEREFLDVFIGDDLGARKQLVARYRGYPYGKNRELDMPAVLETGLANIRLLELSDPQTFDKLFGLSAVAFYAGSPSKYAFVFKQLRGAKEVLNLEEADPNLVKELEHNYATAEANFKQKAIEFAASEESGSQHRVDLLKAFDENPANGTVWEEAYRLAVQEEQSGVNPFSELEGISVAELIELSKKIRNMPDFRERYRLMTGQALNGKLWFDVLTGFSSPDVEIGVENYLHGRIEKTGGRKFEVAADLGCGTGRVAERLAKYSKQTMGLDASDAMVAIAQQRSGNKIHYQVGDVTELPLEDSSVDAMTAVGIIGALDAQQESQFFGEVSRVLKEGGMLIDGYWENNAQAALIKLSWKNTLADMIVDTVSGKTQINHLNQYQRNDALKRAGLATMKCEYSWIPNMFLMVYEKDRAKLAAQYRGYSSGSDGG